VATENLTLLQGQEFSTQYTNRSEMCNYVFCKHCGTKPFVISKKSEWTQGGASIILATLDDISVEELNSIPLTYYNGKDNTWSVITDPEIIKTLY
jgi:hypothetical protein